MVKNWSNFLLLTRALGIPSFIFSTLIGKKWLNIWPMAQSLNSKLNQFIQKLTFGGAYIIVFSKFVYIHLFWVYPFKFFIKDILTSFGVK